MHEIRLLRTEEWPRFKDFYRTLVAESSYLIHEHDELPCPRSLPERDLMHSPVFIVEQPGEWIGYLSFLRGCTRRTLHRGDFSMAVRRDYRRRGVGKSLLRYLEMWSARNGIARIELSVMAQNDAALKLYESAGFVREGLKTKALLIDGNFIDGIFMSKWLNHSVAALPLLSRHPDTGRP